MLMFKPSRSVETSPDLRLLLSVYYVSSPSEGQKDGQTVTYDGNIIRILSFITLMSVKSVFHDLFICNESGGPQRQMRCLLHDHT